MSELDLRRSLYAAAGVVVVAFFLAFIGLLIRRIRIAIDKLTEV